LIRPHFFIFGLVFVSRDFELGTSISCEVDRQSRVGLIYFLLKPTETNQKQKF